MSTRNASKHLQHQTAYLERRKAGLKPVVTPWHWLTLADVQRLASEAFRIASYQCRDAAFTPELFTESLQQTFEVLVADAATASGFHVAPSFSQDYAQAMRADLPASWSPQYPVYAPAKTTARVQAYADTNGIPPVNNGIHDPGQANSVSPGEYVDVGMGGTHVGPQGNPDPALLHAVPPQQGERA